MERIRPCNKAECFNNFGGDISKPMCYMCKENPYRELVALIAEGLIIFKTKERTIPNSNTKWDARVTAWNIIQDCIRANLIHKSNS